MDRAQAGTVAEMCDEEAAGKGGTGQVRKGTDDMFVI